MSSKSRAKYRLSAYHRQQGRCIYCFSPMWLERDDCFLKAYGLTTRQFRLFKCTAEHLIAKADGGHDSAENIAAACLFCNSRRGRCKPSLNADAFLALVQERSALGKWPTAVFLKTCGKQTPSIFMANSSVQIQALQCRKARAQTRLHIPTL